MTNNDVLRTLRYALELGTQSLLATFTAGGVDVDPAHLAAMLKRDDEPGFEPVPDDLFGSFLDGLIDLRRGKREADGRPPQRLAMNNNRVLRSLKIALELKDTDVIAIMKMADVAISKGEISALFRREGQRNYKPCGDQFLRNFLRGLGAWHREGQQKSG